MRNKATWTINATLNELQPNGDNSMLLKLLALGFVALVFLGLGLSGTLNAAFAGYDKVENNPTVQQVQNKVLTVESAIKTQFENEFKSEIPRHGWSLV